MSIRLPVYIQCLIHLDFHDANTDLVIAPLLLPDEDNWLVPMMMESRVTSVDTKNLYTAELLSLQGMVPKDGRKVPSVWSTVQTPLCLPRWEALLANHPDRDFSQYIYQGLSDGFRIGYNYDIPHKSAKKNMKSTMEQPQVLKEYIGKEVAAGRLLVPIPQETALTVHVSPCGVIPKSQVGKWSLIVDMSSPEGSSINDGIPKELCSLRYVTVDDIISKVLKLGQGAFMAKVDIESAYRIVPVHPEDRHLLGIHWQEKCYVDTALPFRMRSAPKIFNAVADGLEWQQLRGVLVGSVRRSVFIATMRLW